MTVAATPRADELRQLERALRPREVAVLLEQAFPGLLGRRVACRIVDVKYEPRARCRVLYQLDDRLVLGCLWWGDGESPDGGAGKWIDALSMRAYEYPHDPAIPGMASALAPGAMERVLAEALPECRAGLARPLRARVSLLRYRPGRRCTVRVDAHMRDRRGGEIAPRTLYVKLYHDAVKAAAVYEEMRALHAEPSLRADGCLVARPAGLVSSLGLVLQEPVAGAPLDGLLQRRAERPEEGSAEVCAAAAAVAALHGAGVEVDRVRPVTSGLGKLMARARAVESVAPQPGTELRALVEALVESVPLLGRWGPRRTLVHGDCKPSQFLVGRAGVGLLDFDHCGMADPASDVGTFMATLRQHALRHELKARGLRVAPRRAAWLRQLEGDFLRAYARAVPPDPGLMRRAEWYESVALARKALRSFQRSARSPLTDGLLREARVCLASTRAPNSDRRGVNEAMNGARR